MIGPVVVHEQKQRPETLGRHYYVDSTAYDPCSSGSIMATGERVYWGAVANNMFPLRTWIKLDHPIHGRTYFRVMDRIGWGTQLDVWMPSCSEAIDYGRRVIGFRIVKRR